MNVPAIPRWLRRLTAIPCPTLAVGLLTTSLVFPSRLAAAEPALRQDPTEARHGLVVSVDRLASRAGAQILHQGGNAVDAAVTTALVLAVTHPAAGNLGGGGFMVARLAKTGECFAVDYRETAPRLATPEMFLDDRGQIDPQKVQIGWLVVGVPGSPMGLWTAHQKAGRLPWRQLVAPAMLLAEEGFVVDEVLSRSLRGQEKTFVRMGEPARVYLDKQGKAPVPGSLLKLPELGETLRRIMELGPEGFYTGPVAERIERAMRQNGGLVRREDLAKYRAVIRQPVRGSYRGYEILSICPPSSGGTVLIGMLNILEGFDLATANPQAPHRLHLLAEAMKRAFYDRAKYLGDPDFNKLPMQLLLSKAHADRWRQGIGEQATPAAEIGADILTVPESEQTTHFSVVDVEGNMVSNTTTLEGSYGAKVIAPGTGFLLNNEMHDFNVKPGLTDTEGHIGTKPNLVVPGKRMLSSQTPTLVLKDNRPFMIVGSPGGRTIINTVLQVILNVIDHGMDIQAAVDAGRVHHQWQPDVLSLEKRIPEEAAEALRAKGHRVSRRSQQGDCHAILIDPQTGLYHPGVDRRIRGCAVGY